MHFGGADGTDLSAVFLCLTSATKWPFSRHSDVRPCGNLADFLARDVEPRLHYRSVMTNTEAVPLAEGPETIAPASPSDLSGCVILAAASAAPVSEIARRIAATLAHAAIDITGMAAHEALPHVHGRNAVFLISGTDWPCLKLARKRAAWLREHGLLERCGLVLWHVEGGASAALAEDFTGLPVCAFLHHDQHVERFAEWIGAQQRRTAVSQLGALDA